MVIVMHFKVACVSFNAFGEEHDWGGGCPIKCILNIHAELGIASSFVVAVTREQAI